jgi:hypothetical protein
MQPPKHMLQSMMAAMMMVAHHGGAVQELHKSLLAGQLASSSQWAAAVQLYVI